MTRLNETTLLKAVNYLGKSDSNLQSVIDQFGPPPLWSRQPGFPTLVHIILEQQVSLASAKACFDKLNAQLPDLDPQKFLLLSNDELLSIGFSRQKTTYTRVLANAIMDGSLKINELTVMTDAQVFEQLTALKGIGPWTANIFLLMALGRPDIWPGGDLALVVALKNLLKMDHRPSLLEFEEMGEKWRPYRAVAARILWHYYLST